MWIFKQLSVLSLMVTWAHTASVPPSGVLPPSLMAQLHKVINGLAGRESQTDSTTPLPPPGNMDICSNLCPKWCEKIEGSPRKYTHCHYMCGNLCNTEVRINNHFIGNPRYEVVPSEYRFDRYDKDGDKMISIVEFSMAEQITVEEAAAIFKFSDFDENDLIDIDEFHGSPLVFTEQMSEELSSMAKTRAQTKP